MPTFFLATGMLAHEPVTPSPRLAPRLRLAPDPLQRRAELLPRHEAEIARMLGISRQHLHDIPVKRKPVSPEVAVRLAKLFGNAPLLWIRMQGAYDAWHAAREVDVSAMLTLVAVE